MDIGDEVEVVTADKHHECARIGQRARVIGRQGPLLQLHLRCGHVWPMPEASLRQLDATEVETPVRGESNADRKRREQEEAEEQQRLAHEEDLSAFDDE